MGAETHRRARHRGMRSPPPERSAARPNGKAHEPRISLFSRQPLPPADPRPSGAIISGGMGAYRPTRARMRWGSRHDRGGTTNAQMWAGFVWLMPSQWATARKRWPGTMGALLQTLHGYTRFRTQRGRHRGGGHASTMMPPLSGWDYGTCEGTHAGGECRPAGSGGTNGCVSRRE
jgi:hypothetical protein